MPQIEAKNPGVLEVPAGKNVNDLPQSHFENLVNKIGYEKVIRALTNLEVWNKDKNKALSTWASNMADKLKKKFRPDRPESAQKNEDKEFTIKSITPFGKTKIAAWDAVDANAAVKEFLDANPVYRDNKKGTIIAESTQKNEAAFKVGDKVTVIDRDMMTYDANGEIYSIKGNEYFVKFKDSLVGTTLIPHTANQLRLKKESISTKQLLEAANRKCEMRWKVLAFNPDEDNKLVKEFKDFDCIDCAAAKKREYLEKNPTHIVEIISESKVQRNEAGKEIKVSNQRFYVTSSDGVLLVKKIAPYDDADYYYAVYDPQRAQLVFTQNGGKNKRASMVKYNDTTKQLEEIAKKLIELNKQIQPKMTHESKVQRNEASSLQALNKELANNVENLYVMAKHVRDRFKYRTLQNMSYDEVQAEKIYDQIEAVIEDAIKKLAAINSKVIG